MQALLDESGQSQGCTAPATIRRAALSCGAMATDLDLRIGLLSQPVIPKPWVLGPLPGPCAAPPGVLPPPAIGSTSAIVVPGPTILITPPAPRSPQVVYTTVGGQACGSTVYTTGRREGAGQPVPSPRTLPGFPDAVWASPKTPKQGGGGMRERWKGADGRTYEWDSQHGTVEVYNKKGTRHLGEYDPDTGEPVKPPNPTRRVEA